MKSKNLWGSNEARRAKTKRERLKKRQQITLPKTQREIRIQRKKWREYQRNYREKARSSSDRSIKDRSIEQTVLACASKKL